MCGVAGIVDPRTRHRSDALAELSGAMAAPLSHRGPDDRGSWADPAAGVVVCHTRLAVIDLSPTGHQPMHSSSGRWVVSYNGEIYNFGSLRAELDATGHRFAGSSDTEVLLAAVEQWGVTGALGRFDGMFAFALWDRRDRVLFLARDRMGEKPMYYGFAGGDFVFGSELKSLRAHPDFDREVDRGAVALLLRHKYIPAPHSVYRAASKLAPGCVLRFDPGRAPASVSVSPYWSLDAVARAGLETPFAGDDEAAVDEVEGRLRAAVRQRMVADVALGAFLSGGIDSSTVVALMQADSTRAVKTFTVGSEDATADEAGHARAVARHLGTDHTELYVSGADALAVVPLLPTIYDEPFADQSQIPSYLISQLARRHVTVSLSGDGGDELFGGYSRYGWTQRRWRQLERLPQPVRRLLRTPAGLVARWAPDRPRSGATRHLGGRLRRLQIDDTVSRGARALAVSGPVPLYREMVSDWSDPASVVLGASEPSTPLSRPLDLAPRATLTERLMYLDARTYLPDDILVKLDRASMAVSLETRVPLLDHHVVELSWRLPVHHKVRDGETKWVLRRVLDRYVPSRLVERPKMGFGVPLSSWLRGPLRDWAATLLDARRLGDDGFFDPAAVARIWGRHLDGLPRWTDHVWTVLMFQAWLDEERSGPRAPGVVSAPGGGAGTGA